MKPLYESLLKGNNAGIAALVDKFNEKISNFLQIYIPDGSLAELSEDGKHIIVNLSKVRNRMHHSILSIDKSNLIENGRIFPSCIKWENTYSFIPTDIFIKDTHISTLDGLIDFFDYNKPSDIVLLDNTTISDNLDDKGRGIHIRFYNKDINHIKGLKCNSIEFNQNIPLDKITNCKFKWISYKVNEKDLNIDDKLIDDFFYSYFDSKNHSITERNIEFFKQVPGFVKMLKSNDIDEISFTLNGKDKRWIYGYDRDDMRALLKKDDIKAIIKGH